MKNLETVAEAPRLKMSSLWNRFNWHEEHLSQCKNYQKLWYEMKHCPFSLKGSHWKLRQQHDQHLQRETRQILGSEYKLMSTMKNVSNLSKVVRDRKIITDSTKCICSTRISYPPVLMMRIKVLRGTYIIRGVDWENLIYVRWNRLKKWKKRSGKWLTKQKENAEWNKGHWKTSNLKNFKG